MQRRNWYLKVLLTGALAMVVFFFLSGELLGSELPLFIPAFLWVLLGTYAHHRFYSFPCPRCGKPFDRLFLRLHVFARRCVNCGLPRYSN